jgi:PAS domain S-box-containing protein
MVSNPIADSALTARDFLSGGGQMSVLMRALDWTNTPLGAVEDWPQSLRTSVSMCLASRFPIVLYWGSEYIVLYNDAYSTILGSKHPWALGQRCRDCWAEIWETIGPMLDGVVATGEATWSDNLLLELQRFGYPEECYFSFSFSPIRVEDGAIGGVFTAVIETTARLIAERRLNTLRELAARVTEAHSQEETLVLATEALGRNHHDISFSVLYLLTPDGGFIEPKAWSGIPSDHVLCSGQRALDGSEAMIFRTLADVVRSGEFSAVTDLPRHCENVPVGLWGVPPVEAIALPLLLPGHSSPLGCLLVGLNAHKRLDQDYRQFLEMIARQLAGNLSAARVHEEERRRTKMLAELDHAKTVFFSNVSHEFRTPLTLMVGPVEAMLERARPSASVTREELQLVHRNSMRLLKLVNALLDFSRIEAGRAQAVYELTDLAALTSETASAFRSAMEQAGLEFVIDCPSLEQPAYVDREMWEKIVLNLISNAFKFTLSGGITVRLQDIADRIELCVEDTGIGIPDDQQTKVFERFHRLEGVPGRTHEGTGIGLALVQELVKLHKGFIRVESTLGKGSKFIVSIPKARAHLPADRLGSNERFLRSTGVSASAYVDEALRWLPDKDRVGEPPAIFASDSVQAPHVQTTSGTILLADDNADMRMYVRQLLGNNYKVHVVSTGIDALAAIRSDPPDLVLTDVMMPELDGFGLLHELRASESTKTIPVILLSARAGEDARVEGMQAGADDYIVKPFTARELLARVGAHLAMGRLRREAAEHERALRAETESAHKRTSAILESIRDSFFALDQDWRFTYVNAEAEHTLNMSRDELTGRVFWDVFSSAKGTSLEMQYRRAMSERIPVQFENYYAPWERWFEVRLYPANDGGISVFYQDITERKQIEQALEQSRQQLELQVDKRTAELQRANRELHELSARLQQTQDEERRHLARALHDSAGQLLAAVAMNIAEVKAEVNRLSPERANRVHENEQIINQLTAEIRTVSHLLHPPLLDEVGLCSALRWYVDGFGSRSKINATLELPDKLERLSADVEIAIFRAVQECLTNAHRHSGCRSCAVRVYRDENQLTVEVRDDGKGIPQDKRQSVTSSGGGVGLRGISERIRQLGGNLEIQSNEHGTAIIARLPITDAIPSRSQTPA